MFRLKKGLLILIAAMLSLSMAACGDNNDDNSASSGSGTQAENTASSSGGEASAETDGTPMPTAAPMEDASKYVNMNKVDGVKLDDTDAENDTLDDSGEIDGFKISIDEAKVIDYEGEKVIIVSYEFENKTSSPRTFASMMETEVTQGGVNLASTVVSGVEGVNTNSAIEYVDTNDSITLQGAYILRDEQSDVNVVVHKYGEPAGASISKAFKLQ